MPTSSGVAFVQPCNDWWDSAARVNDAEPAVNAATMVSTGRQEYVFMWMAVFSTRRQSPREAAAPPHLPILSPERSCPTRLESRPTLYANGVFHTNPGTSAAMHAQLPMPLAPIAAAPSILGFS